MTLRNGAKAIGKGDPEVVLLDQPGVSSQSPRLRKLPPAKICHHAHIFLTKKARLRKMLTTVLKSNVPRLLPSPNGP